MQKQRRLGAVNSLYVMVGAACAVLAMLGAMLFKMANPQAGDSSGSLFMYCGASTRPAVEKVVADYQREYGQTVQVQYGGSNTLLSQIEVGRGVGDLFLSADDVYITMGQERGLISEAMPLAEQRPVIGVRKGNPKNIRTIDDLLRDDVKSAFGNPDQTAIGNLVRKLLVESGHWQKLEEHVTDTGTFQPTVPAVAADVKIGSVDAGIVWDTTVAQYPDLEGVAVPELDGAAQIMVGVLSDTKNPTAAMRFARYLTARDKGLKRFAEHDFPPIAGDKWAEMPELTFYCGAVNRRAVEPVIRAFEQREGVRVNTVYNGCGILTGQMKIILNHEHGQGFPDTYMACDRYYLDLAEIKPFFQEDVDVSDTEVVIVVPKGNPKNIRTLADLSRPGLRVTVGQPEQCTIGVLTEAVLKSEGFYEQVMDNVVSQTESSAMLIPTVTAGSVDATLAYRTDTLAEGDKIDVIPIDSAAAKAVQPFAISRSSDYKYLARRLYRAIASSRASFESAGFHWRLNGPRTSESPDS